MVLGVLDVTAFYLPALEFLSWCAPLMKYCENCKQLWIRAENAYKGEASSSLGGVRKVFDVLPRNAGCVPESVAEHKAGK